MPDRVDLIARALQYSLLDPKQHEQADATRKRNYECNESFSTQFLLKDSIESIRESLTVNRTMILKI